MTPLAVAMLLGYPVVAVVLFGLMPCARALAVTFVAGWMFLPQSGFLFAGLPNYDKGMAIALGALAGTLVGGADRLLTLRPSWLDVPMLAWCLVPLASSLSNGLGLYDGISGIAYRACAWALPYLLGRAHFRTAEDLRELAVVFAAGGLVYVPLCLFEVRMSPVLNTWIYGFRTNHMVHNRRYGGFRPTVFMHSGLMVGLWMSCCTLAAIWLHRAGKLRSILGVPTILAIPAMLVTTVLVKAIGAIVLLVAGFGALWAAQRTRKPWPHVTIAVLIVGYVVIRAGGYWQGWPIVQAAEAFDRQRAASLQYRLDNEDLLAEHALDRPVFGWGGWGRNRVKNEKGRDISTTDGYWIIVLGQNGTVGLAAFLGVLLVPPVACVRAWGPRNWTGSPGHAAPAVLSTVPLLFAVDCLPNAMFNPVYVLILGGIGTFALTARRAAAAQARPQDAARLVQLAMEREASRLRTGSEAS